MTRKLRIRHVAPGSLTEAPYNDDVRQIDPDAFEKLKAELGHFGFVEPLIVNGRTGWLIGGHQRLKAARDLGLGEVPIVTVDLDPDEEQALSIALNNPELQGSFRTEGLANILEQFADTSTLELSGFDYDQYQAIQVEARAAVKLGREGDTPPLPRVATSKIGDVYDLGRHILVVDDATTAAAYQQLPEPAAMTFADPPYNVAYTGKTDERLTLAKDDMTDDDYSRFLEAALLHAGANTRGAIYCCYATSRARLVHQAWENAGLHYSTSIAWVKDRWVLSRSDYHNQWEPILYGWRSGQSHYFVGDRTQGNVWEHGTHKRGKGDVWRHRRPAASRLHPTMKPVTLVEQAIRNSSQPDDWILDPFGGSGTTLVAAENLGRKAYIIELDPVYADVVIARFESLHEGEATKREKEPE